MLVASLSWRAGPAPNGRKAQKSPPSSPTEQPITPNSSTRHASHSLTATARHLSSSSLVALPISSDTPASTWLLSSVALLLLASPSAWASYLFSLVDVARLDPPSLSFALSLSLPLTSLSLSSPHLFLPTSPSPDLQSSPRHTGRRVRAAPARRRTVQYTHDRERPFETKIRDTSRRDIHTSYPELRPPSRPPPT
jgi:hypothetical protein